MNDVDRKNEHPYLVASAGIALTALLVMAIVPLTMDAGSEPEAEGAAEISQQPPTRGAKPLDPARRVSIREPGTETDDTNDARVVDFGIIATSSSPRAVEAECKRLFDYAADCRGDRPTAALDLALAWLAHDARPGSESLLNVTEVFILLKDQCAVAACESALARSTYLNSSTGLTRHRVLRTWLRAFASGKLAHRVAQLNLERTKDMAACYRELCAEFEQDPDRGRLLAILMLQDSIAQGATFPAVAALWRYGTAHETIATLAFLGDTHARGGRPATKSSVETSLAIGLRAVASGLPFIGSVENKSNADLFAEAAAIVRSGDYTPAMGMIFAHVLAIDPSRDAVGALALVASDDSGDEFARRSARRALASHVEPAELLALAQTAPRTPESEAESLEQIDLYRALLSSYEKHGSSLDLVLRVVREQLTAHSHSEWTAMYQRHIIRSLTPEMARAVRSELVSLADSGDPRLARHAEEALR